MIILAEILDPTSLLYYENYRIFVFVIGVTSVQIEHDYRWLERSLNPLSTVSTVHSSLIPKPPPPDSTPTQHPNAFPATDCNHKCAPPLFRGMWAILMRLDGIQTSGGETQDGEALLVRRETEYNDSCVPSFPLLSFHHHR
jgi:hypothetical protein